MDGSARYQRHEAGVESDSMRRRFPNRLNLHVLPATTVCALIGVLAGCGASDKHGPAGASGSTSVAATDGPLQLAVGEARTEILAGEVWRLPQDIERAAIDMEWGRLSYEIDPKQPRYEPKTWSGVVRMHALLPDDRRAVVVARSAAGDPNQVEVRIRVGHFGNEAQERLFIEALQKTLNKRPKPVRGWGFELPPVKGGHANGG